MKKLASKSADKEGFHKVYHKGSPRKGKTPIPRQAELNHADVAAPIPDLHQLNSLPLSDFEPSARASKDVGSSDGLGGSRHREPQGINSNSIIRTKNSPPQSEEEDLASEHLVRKKTHRDQGLRHSTHLRKEKSPSKIVRRLVVPIKPLWTRPGRIPWISVHLLRYKVHILFWVGLREATQPRRLGA